MTDTDLFAKREEPITLSPCQSMALRRMLDAMKANDGLYSACPDIVQSSLCDFLMPPYSTAEAQIKALEDHRDDLLRLLDKFAGKIRGLEERLARRSPATPSQNGATP